MHNNFSQNGLIISGAFFLFYLVQECFSISAPEIIKNGDEIIMHDGVIWLQLLVLTTIPAALAQPDYAGETAEGRNFLEVNRNEPGVVTLESGLQYSVMEKGKGRHHPTVDSPCECHYKGTLLNGKKFDSSYDRGEPATFAPEQVIKGWTEAMQLMVEGDKWKMVLFYDNCIPHIKYLLPGLCRLYGMPSDGWHTWRISRLYGKSTVE